MKLSKLQKPQCRKNQWNDSDCHDYCCWPFILSRRAFKYELFDDTCKTQTL